MRLASQFKFVAYEYTNLYYLNFLIMPFAACSLPVANGLVSVHKVGQIKV